MDVIKLHLGCGPHIFAGWLNYDLSPGPGGIALDLRGGLPHPTSSVDFIFTEHFIEHLTRAEGLAFLRECRRVLKPEGVLRCSTPDLKTIVSCYRSKKIDDWAPTWTPATPAQFFNEAMRLWGHQFIYDLDELTLILTEAGFQQVKKVTHHKSSFTELASREIRPPIGDLIVEARTQ